MGRRRKQSAGPVIALAVVALACVAVLVFIFASGQTTNGVSRPKNRVSLANYNRVKVGMTRAQVIAILGKDYTTEMSFDAAAADMVGSAEMLYWKTGENTGAAVGFNNGVVSTKGQTGLR